MVLNDNNLFQYAEDPAIPPLASLVIPELTCFEWKQASHSRAQGAGRQKE